MKAATKAFVTALVTAAPMSGLPSAAHAGKPIELSDHQLDRVTAGAVAVDASALSAGLGTTTIVTTATNTAVGQDQGPRPGFEAQAGFSSGVAVSAASNGASGKPFGGTTSVSTSGSAAGNFVFNNTLNLTSAALGVQIQVGATSVYGQWVAGF